MNIPHLVKMANQIGQFFQSEPDQVQAINDITLHLKRTWEPRMRKAILNHVSEGGEGLLPIVLKAIQENQQLLA
ncbi:MAG: formate dehydrogenase subunit delta [Methylophilaceae bacterium]|nr:formate dehydrogenase subunit delta [Methylophilaceae bacterium]